MGVVIADKKGYKVEGNNVIFNGKARKLDIRYKKENGQSAYASFGIRDEEGKRVQIFVHHLVAYQKFGDKFLDGRDNDEELIVLHLDGNTLNNSYDNIALGIRSQTSQMRIGSEIKLHKSNF